MNALDFLIQEHKAVNELFSEYESTKDHNVAERIRKELSVHMQIEEEILYPVLEDRVPDSNIPHAEEEHAGVKVLINDRERPEEETIAEIKAGVEHHVQEEETKTFPTAREHLSEPMLAHLGEELQARKESLS